MLISDWSSDLCSSDLRHRALRASGAWFPRSFQADAQIAAVIGQLGFGRAFGAHIPADLVDVFGLHLLESGFPGSAAASFALLEITRSEERSVGKECVSTYRARLSPDTYRQKIG